jgi:hypothetical protein
VQNIGGVEGKRRKWEEKRVVTAKAVLIYRGAGGR